MNRSSPLATPAIAVVCDSAATLPDSLLAGLPLQVVPMVLTIDGESFRDGVDLVPGDFYERLAASNQVTTSGASQEDFRRAFEDAFAAGASGIVCVTVASFVSMTHDCAVLAAGTFGDRVIVVDSASASMGEGFVALEAARAAAQGGSLQDVAHRAREVAARVHLVAAIDTFAYLRRSGRVNALVAWAGEALNLKPIFAFRDGKVEQVARVRSTGKAITRIASEVRAAGEGVRLAVCHAAAHDDAKRLLDLLVEECRPSEALLTEFTPLMGAHTGPGLIGVAYWS